MDNTNQLSVTRVPLDAIHQDPANARSHPDENLDAIEASLRRFGQAEPLVVQKSSGRVIGGNGRLAVMKKLAWTQCDVVELEIDDLTATALGIALNRTAERATWNQEALADLLKELQAQGAMEGTGFDDADLNQLLADLEGNEPVEIDDRGEQEPPEKPFSRTGDLWILGSHRLLVGDSTNAADLERLMSGPGHTGDGRDQRGEARHEVRGRVGPVMGSAGQPTLPHEMPGSRHELPATPEVLGNALKRAGSPVDETACERYRQRCPPPLQEKRVP